MEKANKETLVDEAKTSTENAEAKTAGKGKVKEPEKVWLTGEIKEEHMADIFTLIKNYVFPNEAIQNTIHPTMKKEILGYNAQYIINSLNEIIGINHWREYGKMTEEKPANAYVSIYEGTFEVGNWRTRAIKETAPDGTIREFEERYFDALIRHTTYGGSRNMDHWESLKGAKTNFLKKVCSYYSVGWQSYALQLDDDFANLASDKGNEKSESKNNAKSYTQNNTQAPKTNFTKATPPTNKATPPEPKEEEIKMISEAQIGFIKKLYTEYEDKAGENAKQIADLIKPYKKEKLEELTAKQGSEFITQFKKHIEGLK